MVVQPWAASVLSRQIGGESALAIDLQRGSLRYPSAQEIRPMAVWAHGRGRPEPTHIGHLEHRMWLNGYRGDARWFDHHLHPDFVEHGCSGAVWTQDEILSMVVTVQIAVGLPLDNQQMRQLASDTWILTYTSHEPDRSCRRVSIWQELREGWRLRFHQGTPIP